MGGLASSKISKTHGKRMIDRTFDPGFRIEPHQKDFSRALPSVRIMKMSLPPVATAPDLVKARAHCAGRGAA